MPDNRDRMIRLAEEFFATKNDPAQLSVNEAVIGRLQAMHPATLGEERNEDGPIAWVLLIPTSVKIMERFLAGEVGERDLLSGGPYEAVYLCSALVLPEFRRSGLAKRLTLGSIRAMRKDFSVKYLFYWSFSPEGDELAASVAKETGLPVLKRRPKGSDLSD